MAYCAPQDLLDSYDAVHLAQLTGDAAGLEPDDAKIALAIGDYGDYMEAFVRMQHPGNLADGVCTVDGAYDGTPATSVSITGLEAGRLLEKGTRLLVRSSRLVLTSDITGDGAGQTLAVESVDLQAAAGDVAVLVNKMLCHLNVEGAFLLLQKRNPASPGALDEDLLRAERRLDGLLGQIAKGALRLMDDAEKADPPALDVAGSMRRRDRLFGRAWAT